MVEGTPPPADAVGAAVLSAEVGRVLDSLEETHYQHDTVIESPKGVYKTDCSGFVNFALATAVSDAYDDLKRATAERPVAEDYVHFIRGLKASVGRWHAVLKPADLVPGDIVAWRIPPGVKSSDTGHVMVVHKTPVLVGMEADVPIVDSTDTGHGDADPRVPTDPSGVGPGTVVILLHDDGTARGYRWSMDADSAPYTIDIAMAHLD